MYEQRVQVMFTANGVRLCQISRCAIAGPIPIDFYRSVENRRGGACHDARRQLPARKDHLTSTPETDGQGVKRVPAFLKRLNCQLATAELNRRFGAG